MDKRAWQRAADLDTEWGKARETLPGVFSDFLDRLLYDRSKCKTEEGLEKDAFPQKVYLGIPYIPEYIKWNGREGIQANTVETLREIAELLEAYAYRAMKENKTL